MSWKLVRNAFLTTALLAMATTASEAGSLCKGGRHGCASSCAPACGGCGDAAGCAPAPAPAPTYTTKKVMTTEWKSEQYEGTRTVNKTEWKDEKYTYITCERVSQTMTRNVNYYEMVPETRDVVVSRWECVPTQEERTVTRNTYVQKPYTYNTTRCVDKGGHYETREVACHSGGGCGSGGKRCKLFGKRHGGGCGSDCGSGCGDCAPATTTVNVYVANLVTETVPVTVMRNECVLVTEKVKVVVNRMVEKKETMKVTTNRCVLKSRPEQYTVWTTKNVAHEGTRKVAVCTPVTEKVMLTRMVAVQVEKEVTVCTSGCGSDCGSGSCCGHSGGRRLCGGRRGCK